MSAPLGAPWGAHWTDGPSISGVAHDSFMARQGFVAGLATVRPAAGMRIPVAGAVGSGATELAAFDAALVAAGVADRNLIYLSSVLPPGSRVDHVTRIQDTPGGWGDRLYCVMAEARTSCPGAEVWAGIGWRQDPIDGRGLLVEHHADAEAELRTLIAASLDGLCRNRGIALPEQGSIVAGARCVGEPVCALTVAVFGAAAWNTTTRVGEMVSTAAA